LEALLRQHIVAVGRRLYARSLVAATDGNVSARLEDEQLLVTPAGSCLGELEPNDLLCLAPAAESDPALPHARPTSELAMHRCAYAQRPDAAAIVHAHLPHATAITVAGLSLEAPVLPELVVMLGTVPTAPYATPSTAEGARAIEALIGTHDAILLDRHGALAVGTSVWDAYRKLEKLEHAAQVVLAARAAGRVRTLSPAQVARLEALKAQGA